MNQRNISGREDEQKFGCTGVVRERDKDDERDFKNLILHSLDCDLYLGFQSDI